MGNPILPNLSYSLPSHLPYMLAKKGTLYSGAFDYNGNLAEYNFLLPDFSTFVENTGSWYNLLSTTQQTSELPLTDLTIKRVDTSEFELVGSDIEYVEISDPKSLIIAVDPSSDSDEGVGFNNAMAAIDTIGKSVGGIAGNVLSSGAGIAKAAKNLKNLKGTAKAGGIAGIVGMGSDLLGSFMPEKTEYEGDYGSITKGIDNVYDTASDVAMQFGPVGMIVGGAMKGANLLGKGFNALGAGTDGMTVQDSILGSSFFSWNLGALNGAFGKKADTFTKNNEVFSLIGSSYGGTDALTNSALLKSGKKYGLLSSGARNKANEEIRNAKTQQSIMEDIADYTTDRFLLLLSMAAINGNRRALLLLGGYDLSNIRVGKHGIKLEDINKARQILNHRSYKEWYKTVPEDRNNTEYYDLELAFKVLPFEMLENWRTAPLKEIKEGKYHLLSVCELPNGDYIFLKKGRESENPELIPELETYYDGTNGLKDTYDLVFNEEENRYYYIKKKESHKLGGVLLAEAPETTIFAVEPISEVYADIPEFKEGGSFNVIPEGALHARLHHMEDAENLTKKGIPVVSENEDGEIELQAEIEREEIIYRLEVTKELERLAKIYNSNDFTKEEKDWAAITAGKLLVKETLYNTIDNTNNLL